MELDVLISGVLAIFALVVSIVSLILNRRIARENVRQQEVGVAQWRHDLRDWASDAIDVLSEAVYACEATPDASPGEFRPYLHRLWALIDRGRLFLPNQQPEERDDPVLAFRGYRHRALDALWAAGNVLEDRADTTLYGGADNVARYRRYVLEELQREFVSNISLILDPVHHNSEISRIIEESERDIKKASARQVKALGPQGTPPGDKLGLGLTRLHGAIRVKRSGSVKGVEDGQDRQALLA